jgi:hypothetical protein
MTYEVIGLFKILLIRSFFPLPKQKKELRQKEKDKTEREKKRGREGERGESEDFRSS